MTTDSIWVKYYKQKQDFHESYCVYMATIGDIQALRYLNEHGCIWTDLTARAVCAMAATGGHLDCLKYVHEHGCPFSSNEFQLALIKDNVDIVQYLHKQGCPLPVEVHRYITIGGKCDLYCRDHGINIECKYR